jgi:cell wall-associated NlpC family hydrolase
LWSSQTSGPGNYLAMQPEGNLVMHNGGTALWNTSTWGFPGAYLQLQNDGNLVLYQSGHAIWAYGSGYKGQILNPGEDLQPGAYLLSPDHEYQLIMQSDGNLVLYHEGTALWSSQTSGPGNYLAMQPEGNLVMHNGGTALWNTSTWGFPGAYLVLQDDSNLVIYQSGTALWDWMSGKLGGGGTVGQQIVSNARKWLGTPYCWDGGEPTVGPTHGKGDWEGEAPDCTNPATKGFDCGGLVQYAVYQATGGAILMPHEQNGAYQRFASGSVSDVPLTESAWQEGDVLVFSGGNHVGIYVGGGRMIDADTAYYLRPDGVQEAPVSWVTSALPLTRVLRVG